MASARGEFSSRLGFIMAAAGSAVGLGNIWGFPTQAASNGGAAFLLVYLLLAFALAYPALMAELIIGRHAHANAVDALRSIAPGRKSRIAGSVTGLAGVVTASAILSFYAIVAGWMIAHAISPMAQLVGAQGFSDWLVEFSLGRNIVFMLLFMGLTIGIIRGGVHDGIERWSSRLMPVLMVTLLALVLYVMTMDGAMQGLEKYLLPDFNAAMNPDLIIKALGSAFFSLSLGVGTMLVYGSYISDKENLPVLGGMVTLIDISIAILAGFLVLPAMYVALNNGVEIYNASGALISEDTLIFTVLPALFDTMGSAGIVVSIVFFGLMIIAALTSSISILEVPVAYAIESHQIERHTAVWLIGAAVALGSTVILLNFDTLFSLVISISTRYSQPLLGFMYCIFCGWLWHRNSILQELRKGAPEVESSWFWKIWPWYIRVVCPLVILVIFAHAFFS
jgi:NSS family neurotransmitter:Na+ symporter